MPAINSSKNRDILSSQRENLYSLDHQEKNPDCVCDSSDEKEKIEPFDCEKDALEFANYYSQKVLNEER